MRRLVPAMFVLCLIVPAVAVAAGPVNEGLETDTAQYFALTDSPISGPVEMFVQSNHPYVQQGTFTDVALLVKNHSNEATVSIVIDLDLVYADGRSVQPFHLGQERVHTLGTDEGVGFMVFFVVPPDAPLGAGTFRASARVARVTGDDDGHADNPNPMIASDSFEFEVVAPAE